MLSHLSPPYHDCFLNLCRQNDPFNTFKKELPIMKNMFLDAQEVLDAVVADDMPKIIIADVSGTFDKKVMHG